MRVDTVVLSQLVETPSYKGEGVSTSWERTTTSFIPMGPERCVYTHRVEAIMAAAKRAVEAAAPPPPEPEAPADTYTPVVMYRRPEDYLAAAPPLSLLARKARR